MKKLIAFLLLATTPAHAASIFDDVIIENSCTVPTRTQGDNSTNAANTAYVDAAVLSATIPDATTTVKGKLKLAGDLAGTADLPTVPGLAGKEPTITAGTTSQYWRGDKTFQTLNSAAVGLGNVDNTNDTNKPVSTATQTALNAKYDASNPSSYVNAAGAAAAAPVQSVAGKTGVVTLVKGDVGLGNVDNTSDANKPISTATQSALDAKEPSISAGTTAQYWRGDKTFQNFNTAAQGAVSATAPLIDTAGVFSIPQSSSSVDGYLAQSDWSTFNNKAPTNSPVFTGVPVAPTASVGTSTTQIATTAFVLSQGFQGATGSMPNAVSTTLASTTSASTTFVTAITTPITVTASSAPVLAKCVLDITSATAASVATVRVTVNGVSGGSVTESLTTATTQHLTVPAQNLSAALGPGTYTVNCDFNRASGTGTITVAQGSLNAVALQGTESNGISQLTGLGLAAGPGSGLQSLTGTLTMAGGGTNANNTAVNGGLAYSTASAINIGAAGSLGQIARSSGAGAPTWTSETFPASTTINQILYSSAANVVSGLVTANTGVLVTSSTGVPSVTSCSTANRVLRTNGTTVSCAQLNLGTDVVSVASQRVPFGNGTGLVTDASFIYDTTNTRLSVGGSGTATINAIVASGSKTALQAFNSSAGNAFQSTNVSAYTAALINRSASAATGASIGMEFGRGTPASPTGALSGDQIGVIVATPDASDGNAYGYAGAISFVAAENATTTATGGHIVLSTTPTGGSLTPVEHVRIKSSGETQLTNSHLTFSQTVAPTAVVQANAGTGASCSLSSDSTDVMGQVSITTGTIGVSTGSYCRITYNVAHTTNPPRCQVTQAGTTLSTSVGAPSTPSNFDISFGVAGGISATYLVNYFCPGSP